MEDKKKENEKEQQEDVGTLIGGIIMFLSFFIPSSDISIYMFMIGALVLLFYIDIKKIIVNCVKKRK